MRSNSLLIAGPDALLQDVCSRAVENGDAFALGRASQLLKSEPEPHVRRVVYIAVPHRGSNFADNAIGRFGRWLVKLLNNESTIV